MSNVNSCQKCGRDLTKLNQYNIKTHINLCKGTREMYLRPINNFFSKQSLSNMLKLTCNFNIFRRSLKFDYQ